MKRRRVDEEGANCDGEARKRRVEEEEGEQGAP
jgi:hypothetical protein